MAERAVAAVRRDAWFLRLYLWMWRADENQVTFCRLFWGYVLAVPNLIVRAFVLPFWLAFHGLRLLAGALAPVFLLIGLLIGMLERLSPRTADRSPADARNEPKVREAQRASRIERSVRRKARLKRSARCKARLERVLDVSGKGADHVVSGVQFVWPVLRWSLVPIGALLVIAVGLLIGYGLYLGLPFVWVGARAAGMGIAWLIVNVGLDIVVGIGLVLALVAFAIPLALGGLHAAETRTAKRAGRKTKRVTLGFFGAIGGGAKAVKHRTCPIIRVVDNE